MQVKKDVKLNLYSRYLYISYVIIKKMVSFREGE